MSRRVHRLKIWPEHFRDVISCRKTFEIRRSNRSYQCGDWLVLEEWDPETSVHEDRYTHYTGRCCVAAIQIIVGGFGQSVHGLPPDLCVIGIRVESTGRRMTDNEIGALYGEVVQA